LESLINLLGCGKIQVDTKRFRLNFIISKCHDIINIVIALFNKIPVMSSKSLDFKDFCLYYTLIKNQFFLSLDDYNTRSKIKSCFRVMNKARVTDVVGGLPGQGQPSYGKADNRKLKPGTLLDMENNYL